MTKKEAELLARPQEKTVQVGSKYGSFRCKLWNNIWYTKKGHLQPKLSPSKSIQLVIHNHPTLVPLTWRRTCLWFRLVQCLIICMISKQINHIEHIRDILIIWQLEHISIIINLPSHSKWTVFYFSNIAWILGKWLRRKCIITKSPSWNTFLRRCLLASTLYLVLIASKWARTLAWICKAISATLSALLLLLPMDGMIAR